MFDRLRKPGVALMLRAGTGKLWANGRSGPAGALSISAASTRQLKSMTLEHLGNVEVTTVSRQPEEVWRTPVAACALTQKEIQRSGATTLPDLLPGWWEPRGSYAHVHMALHSRPGYSQATYAATDEGESPDRNATVQSIFALAHHVENRAGLPVNERSAGGEGAGVRDGGRPNCTEVLEALPGRHRWAEPAVAVTL
jgi:hypothetical protein